MSQITNIETLKQELIRFLQDINLTEGKVCYKESDDFRLTARSYKIEEAINCDAILTILFQPKILPQKITLSINVINVDTPLMLIQNNSMPTMYMGFTKLHLEGAQPNLTLKLLKTENLWVASAISNEESGALAAQGNKEERKIMLIEKDFFKLYWLSTDGDIHIESNGVIDEKEIILNYAEFKIGNNDYKIALPNYYLTLPLPEYHRNIRNIPHLEINKLVNYTENEIEEMSDREKKQLREIIRNSIKKYYNKPEQDNIVKELKLVISNV